MAVVLYPWQQSAFEHWQAQVLMHPAQAYLLMGAEGHGADAFARAMVQALLCTAGGCGQCSSCRQLAAEHHADFYPLTLPTGKKEIPVETIRELAQWVVESPHCAQGLKVVWLHPVEKLSLAAANALLKTLEEPPSGVVFILQAKTLGGVLPTIRSRCQLLSAPLAQRDEALAWLKERLPEYAPQQLSTALEKHFYAPVSAYQWLKSGGWKAYETWRMQMTQLSRGQVDLVTVAEAWSKLEDPAVPLYWLLSWCEQQQKQVPSRTALSQLQQVIYEALKALEGNANIQLALERVLITHLYGAER